MPALKNSRYEAFAHQQAQGLNPQDAALAAGFAKSQTQACRRALRPEIVARVEELKRLRDWGGSRDLRPLINELGAAVQEARTLNSAAAFVAVRGLIVEAARLKQMLPEPEPEEPDEPPPRTSAEWLARHRPKTNAETPPAV